MQEGPLIISHRGATHIFPENTVEACRFAVEQQGASALEVDLSYSKDGHVFLWHDWVPNMAWAYVRELGLARDGRYRPRRPWPWDPMRKPADQLTFNEIQKHYGYAPVPLYFKPAPKHPTPHIPTLRHFLTWASRASRLEHLFLDIKMPAYDVARAPAMLDAIHEALTAADSGQRLKVVLLVGNKVVLSAMVAHNKERGYGMRFGCSVKFPRGIVWRPSTYSAVACAQSLHVPVASVGRPSLTLFGWHLYVQSLLREIERFDAHRGTSSVDFLIAWTINRPREMRHLARLPLSGIVTDDVPALRKALSSVRVR